MKSFFLALMLCFSIQAMEKVATTQKSLIERPIIIRTFDNEDTHSLTVELANGCDWIRETIQEHPLHGTPEKPLMLPITSAQGTSISFFYSMAKLCKKDETMLLCCEGYSFNRLADILKGLYALGNGALFTFVANGLRMKYYAQPHTTNLENFITTLGLSVEIQLLLRSIYWPKG